MPETEPLPGESDWVQIKHSDVKGDAVVTRQAFEEVYKSNGWTLAADRGYSNAAPEPVEGAAELKAAAKAAKES